MQISILLFVYINIYLYICILKDKGNVLLTTALAGSIKNKDYDR
jgi:hypothetical protein